LISSLKNGKQDVTLQFVNLLPMDEKYQVSQPSFKNPGFTTAKFVCQHFF